MPWARCTPWGERVGEGARGRWKRLRRPRATREDDACRCLVLAGRARTTLVGASSSPDGRGRGRLREDEAGCARTRQAARGRRRLREDDAGYARTTQGGEGGGVASGRT